MRPILFESTQTTFTRNGLGVLTDATRCVVSQERNGEYELEMDYPITGIHYDALARRRIILAQPDQVSNPQPFRIYSITRPLAGIVTVYARHIAYDLMGVPVRPYIATDAASAMTGLASHVAVQCPFVFTTDQTTQAAMTVAAPIAVWDLLSGNTGGILDCYGGEYEFDGYTVKLCKQRGKDRGMIIRYAKNLTELQQDESCANVYTGIYPYWANENGDLTELPEGVVAASGDYDYTRIKVVDFSEEWENAPTAEQLRARAARYITSNQIGTPSISLKVGYAQLGTETLGLCDTITVISPPMGISVAAKCIRTKFDVLRERYDNVEIGTPRAWLPSTLANQFKRISAAPSRAAVRTILEQRVKSITAEDIGAVTPSELTAASKTLGLTSAEVGQIPVITAVDDNGTPTSWATVQIDDGNEVEY